MRTRVVAVLALASSLAFFPITAHGQRPSSELALSFGAGSAFEGASVGLARASAATGSAFSSGAAYGGYDDGYWRSRYFGGRVHSRFGGYGCADVWRVFDGPYHGVFDAGFYDDWFYFSDLYYDCVVRGPSWVYHRYHAYRPFYHGYRPFHHGYRPYGYFRPRSIFISIAIFDPFWPVWGPFWAYDPWGRYGTNWVVYSGRPHVGTLFVSPSPVYRRASPIYTAGTTFKEDPRGAATGGGVPGRSAQPRPSSAPAASAPANGLAGVGVQAPPRRGAGTSGGNTADVQTLSGPTGGRTAAPRRSGETDGASPGRVAPGPAGNGPRGGESGVEPARRGAPPVQGQPSPSRPSRSAEDPATGSVLQTPSSVNRPSSRAGDARPTSALPRVITPQDRPSSGPTVTTLGEGQPSDRLPQVIVPRGSAQPRAESAEESPPVERLTGPAVQPQRPSDRSRASSEPGSAPSAAQRPDWSAAGRAQPERSTLPERSAPPQRQAQPGRQPQGQVREAPPETRQAPPETRQSQPQTRQSPPPQARQAPPPQTRQSPPPQTRQTPSRPSGGQAQPAPQAPSAGGARPMPAPRRPPGG